MTRSLGAKIVAIVLGASLVAACGSDSDDGDSGTTGGKVELSFWAWAPNIEKVIDKWNAANPDIHVTLSRQAGGGDIVTKLLTAHKAGNPPDLAQVEYQSLPTLVSNDVLADIAKETGDTKGKFADGVWQQVTLGTDAVYGIPQDAGPMMLYYRTDLFQQYGLTVPKTWEEFAQTARTVRTKAPKQYLTTFSAKDPGWFSGLAQQAGAAWWGVNGDSWKVSINDAATKKVADYWGGLVGEGAIDDQPMYTPQWNKQLNDGTLLAWPSAVWGPAVLEGIAPDTKGKWAMAPLPQWSEGDQVAGFWGGSSTAITRNSKHPAEAAEFARWLNTDQEAVAALIGISNVYPASTEGQAAPALDDPPAFMPDDADFFARAAEISQTARGFTWGPNVNVAYQSYKDQFGRAIQRDAPFTDALQAMQDTTVADMEKAGFTVSSR
jgi:multiple sugar transport system substrate-binding protein